MTISSSSECHQSAVGGGGGGGQSDVVLVKCDCCGLTEECTETYIAKVRDRYQGRWICGLCAEAVKYEIVRSSSSAHDHVKDQSTDLIISTEEALNRHMNFCNKFRSSCTPQDPPPNPTKHLISAMRQLLRRSLTTTTTTTTTSATNTRSTPTSPRPKEIITESHGHRLSRSESCFSTLAS